MMVTGFRRVSASGLLLLAMTTTTLVQLAGATSSSDITSAPATSASTGVPVTSDATDAPVASDTVDATTGAPERIADNSQCDTEYAACFEDETCQSCITAASSTLQTYACSLLDSEDSSAQGCAANADYACCLNENSDFECLDSDQFVAYFMCVLDDYGCAVDEITCDGDESTGIARASAAASITVVFGDVSAVIMLSCTMFMALLPLLWA